MNHMVREMVAYLHGSRLHQSTANDLLILATDTKRAEGPEVVRLSDLRCKRRSGGLLEHYYRKAAYARSWLRWFVPAFALRRDHATARCLSWISPRKHRPQSPPAQRKIVLTRVP
jgi:hypothetical protein